MFDEMEERLRRRFEVFGRGSTSFVADCRDLWKFFRGLARAWLAVLRHRPRRPRRVRRPIRSTKADAKRAAHAYARDLTRRDISWKKSRKLLAHLEREGRAKGLIPATPERAD